MTSITSALACNLLYFRETLAGFIGFDPRPDYTAQQRQAWEWGRAERLRTEGHHI